MGFMTGFLNESPKSHFHLDRHSKNIFDKLKTDGSILLTLFNLNNQELLNMGAQAPSPSKNYCQVVLNHNNVIFRTWHISLHVNSDSRFPSENISSYDDFVHDEVLQRKLNQNMLRILAFNRIVFVLIDIFSITRRHSKSIWKSNIDLYTKYC
jgi:hypothetical protein